ncbi:MAG: phenylalanine--tRNA ligase subunit beta [Acidobacteriota bacterium]
MKVSCLWLKEFVDVEVSPHVLAEDLSRVGLVVEGIESRGQDTILELDLTTNRPDCLSHYGVAREIATLYRKPLIAKSLELPEGSDRADREISIHSESPGMCPRYTARVIRGARVAASPDWLVQRLESLGVRPVNNVVDVTNYVLMEWGHPLHAFDLHRVGGRQIRVREARPGETLMTLDGVTRQLEPGMLMIADETAPLALAGIMGGKESEIDLGTSEILLESAWFDPISIRKTARKLGLHTEASHRFERGADIEATVPAINRAAALIRQVAGGTILQGVVDHYPQPRKRMAIELRRARIQRLMGVDIDPETVERILGSLGFELKRESEAAWSVWLPSSRLDVEREVDLIEEVARHYGYERFPSSLPVWSGNAHRLPNASRKDSVKRALLHTGYTESLTYSFIDESECLRFSHLQPVQLANPLSSEMSVMRTSMLPGLLGSLLWNYNRGIKNVKFFEVGKVYYRQTEGEPSEEEWLGMIATGLFPERSVHQPARAFDFFSLKGDLETVLKASEIAVGTLRYERPDLDDATGLTQRFHPGITAEVFLDGIRLGVLGRLHPQLEGERKLRQAVFAAEICLSRLYAQPVRRIEFQEIPRFPAVRRDLSIVVNEEVTYRTIERIIHDAQILEVRKVELFDLYVGEKLPAGKKSVSISVLYQSLQRTLTEDEVNRAHEAILRSLKQNIGAELRS